MPLGCELRRRTRALGQSMPAMAEKHFPQGHVLYGWEDEVAAVLRPAGFAPSITNQRAGPPPRKGESRWPRHESRNWPARGTRTQEHREGAFAPQAGLSWWTRTGDEIVVSRRVPFVFSPRLRIGGALSPAA